MSNPVRLSSFLWTIVPLVALGFLFWLTGARLHRVDYLTNLVETEMAVDPASPTGYAGGLRQLIIPEPNNESCQWIVQTQQMFAQKEWRVRHVSYDNAPVGRTVLTPSPYRWWLGLLAEVDHLVSGRPAGLSVERVARWSDPLLHALFLLGAVAVVAWQFGIAPAGLVAAAGVTLFPLSGAFLPGQPGDDGLVLIGVFWSVLLPLVGIGRGRPSVRPPEKRGGLAAEAPADSGRTARWFFAGGVAGGLGLWIDATRTIPVLAGIALGGALVAWWARRAAQSGSADTLQTVLPWRHWALGGALTTLIAHLVEYSPGYLGNFDLREVHPLHGLAWLGTGELLAGLQAGRPKRAIWRKLASIVPATLAVAALPVVLIAMRGRDLLTVEPVAARLTNLAGSPVAQSLWTWIIQEGITRAVVATCLPALLLAPAAWLLARRNPGSGLRTMLALGFGPAFIVLAFACFQLREWNTFDAGLLGLLVALTAAARHAENPRPWFSAILAGLLLILAPGAVLLVDKALADRRDNVTEGDIEALIERDLGLWLARQAGPDGAVVLAPPNLTVALIYHGGLSGLGSPYWENKDGFIASMRIAGASSPDEAQAVARGRNLSYIVVPSWDGFLDEYAGQGANQAEHTLMASLHRWLPPRWLRPIPYHLPAVAGFEGQSVAIFQVVEVQDNATALSHLAEYFLEMDMPGKAASVANTLEHVFPADLGAAAARALVAQAAGDAPAFGRALADVQAALARGDDDGLLWDRRVSVAVALVEGRRFDLAREQTRRCLAEIDEPRLRSLTNASLQHFQEMCRVFRLEIEDARLRALGQQLLPPELRKQP